MGLWWLLQAVFEASGMDEAANDVAGETTEAQGDAAQVPQAPVDRFGGAAGGAAGAVEVGQDGLSVGERTSPGAQGTAGLIDRAGQPPGPAST